MSRDIEVPNTAVDMNSWAVSACYPRSTFYPLSDGPSIQNHPDHYDLLFAPARAVTLAVKLAYAIALTS